MGKFILFRLDGKHLTYEDRLILQSLWNERIEHLSASLTISSFAREHGLSPETWRREYLKGAEHPPMWNKIKDRPREADDRSEPGHLEMDTVVSSAHGSGGLLVLIDRWSRMYRAVKIRRISQECVLKALRQLVRDGELGPVLSVTTDNGCEFLDDKALEKVFGASVFYTDAYAAYQKGSVENANRMLRRWFPKGTDFALVSKSRVREVVACINAIHRESLGGLSAIQFSMQHTAYVNVTA